MSSAAGGKKGKKKRGQTLDLNNFLQNESSMPDGKAITITKTGNSWADQMDDFETQKTVVLPTAPSSVRGGLRVDPDRIPANGPFKVFIANVSYDANEEVIASMFKGLDVVGVHLPCDDDGRFKGYGYVEFGNKEHLIDALQMDDLEIGGRKLRIDLKTSDRDQGRSGFSSYRESSAADDSSDWRSERRTEPSRDRYGGGYDRDGGGYGGSRGGDREPTMASRPGSKYEAVPSFASFGRGGYDRGGFGNRDDRDRDGPRFDRGGPNDGPWSRDGPRRDGPRYDDKRDGPDDGPWARDGPRRDPPKYDDRRRDPPRDGPRYDDRRDDGPWARDGPRRDPPRDGPRYDDRRDGPRYDDRRDGPRYDDRRDGPRYDDRRDGPRYDDRRDGPRYDDRRDGPRYDDRRDGPRYDDRRDERRDGPRYDTRDGPRRNGEDAHSGDGESTAPSERPRLNLKPRSVPAEQAGQPAPVAASSIFGGAKPVDTAAREREVEERLKGSTAAPVKDREPTGSQRRAEASRDIRLSEPVRGSNRIRGPDEPGESNEAAAGDAAGGPQKPERRERQPRPPPTLEETHADFSAPSKFSALAIDDDDGDE